MMAETENKVPQKDKKRMVKALFNYTPVNIDELPLKINDILEVIEETEEGWWKGTLNGAIGMFPSNFVIELDNLPEELSNHKVNELSPTKNVAKIKNVDVQESAFKHESSHSPSSKHDAKPSTLSSNIEDATDASKCPEPEKKATVSKKSAVDSTAPRLPPKPVREQARVIYPYTALNEDELSLKEGDIITVISKEIEDKGWWKGELNNRTGVFPDNFVQLIKVEEQKKPERPDKPSSALSSKSNLRSSTSDKLASEFSPKTDKKVLKTPPVKPPPPEMHKKEPERPTPPFPSKKPQVPHPMKKPSRSSLGPKLFSGFSPPLPTANSVKASAPEASPVSVSPPVAPAPENKTETVKNVEKPPSKEEKKDNKSDLGFDGLESSGKKLIHLTAGRAKVPNRRPPSHVFLRETDKENGISSSDPRRLSEPLLSEMKSLLQLGESESHKTNISASTEVKAKIPPIRPLPPSIKGNKPVQGSVLLTKTISSEECIVKAPEPIKKSIIPPEPSTSVTAHEVLPPKKIDLSSASDVKSQSSEKEFLELRDNLRYLMGSAVSRHEFNELSKQVKELKEGLENCNNNCKKVINDLKNELEMERKQRQALEIELQQMKERQTT